MPPADECTGVVCAVCGREVFQVVEREAALSRVTKVRVRCCPRCAHQVDGENWEHSAALHTRRKEATKAELREIARSIDGKTFTRQSDVMVAFGYSPRSPMMYTQLEYPLRIVRYNSVTRLYRVHANAREAKC